MNILTQYFIALLVTGVVHLSLAAFVLFKGIKNRINQAYALYSAGIAIWAIFEAFGITAYDGTTALFFWRLNHMGVIFIPIGFVHFVYCAVNMSGWRRKLIPISYVIAFIFVVMNFTNLLILEVVPKFSFRYFINPGLSYYVFFTIWVSWAIYGLFELFKAYFKSSGAKRNQMKYFCWSMLIAYMGGIPNFFPTFNIEIPLLMPFGTYAIPIYAFFTVYAFIRYRLMDINIVFTRAGIFTIVYTFVLGIPFWIGYKYHLWHYATVLMAVLATIGPFIYLRLEKRSKEILYKTEFKRYETLRRFSKTLLLIKELDKLVDLIVYRLVKTLKVTYAGIYLYEKEKDAYILKSYRPLKYPNMPNGERLTKENLLIKLLFVWRRELIREEVVNLPLTKKVGSNSTIDLGLVQYEMQKLSATLVIPHFVENDLLGFLVLGDKEKGAIYTEEDISILSALSNSAALAIENALFLIDLKITQAELFNAKRIAELGYMASAMGHEINNRLQAIYSAALDMVDNPTIYDSIKQNPQLKQAFDKDIAFINENVEDATKIISELKTYAKPQDSQKQALESLNIKDIIDKAISIVRLQSVKAFDLIDLDIKIPLSMPKISGNFIQLQQVFVNLLNNAHDAIIEMKEYVSHHPESNIASYKGKIDIKINEVKNKLNIHIIDNGIGMTEEIKKRVFVPLYTSKATAERKAERGIKGGTGIGLYTIQTIMKGHEGSIEIHKTERLKGADFLITLPLSRDRELGKKG